MSIEISSYRESKKGFCEGYSSFKINNFFMFFNDVAIYNKDGNKWLQFPSRKYEVNGETKYLSYSGFTSKEMKAKFEEKFFQALDKYISEQKKPVKEIPSPDEACPF